MKKWGFLLVCGAGIIITAWLSIKKNDSIIQTYVDYDMQDAQTIKSETTYILDSSNHTTFEICQWRDGSKPCKQIKGIQHGTQKWYEDGILQYEDLYEHGKRTQTTAYYNNGLKQKECRYQDDKITQKNIYDNKNGNPLIKTITYKNDEVTKQYYVNNRIHKEEKYHNNKLVSRRIYDSDGRLQRLEEYNFIGNADSFDSFLDGFDSANPFLFDGDMLDNFEGREIPKDRFKKSLESQESIWI